jgi:hypothetical protein
MAFERQVIGATNPTFYITLGYSLLMVFLILYLKILESRTKGGICLAMLCFVALYFTYYSAEFFALAFSFSLFMIEAITRLGRKKAKISTHLDKSFRSFLYLPLAFLVLFIGFDTAVYQFFQIHASIYLVVSYIGSFIGNVFNLLYITLLLIPIVLHLLLYSINKLKTGATKSDKTEIKPTYLAFIFAAATFSFIYFSFGMSLFSRAFYIFFPLLALYSISQLKLSFRRRFINYILTTIIIFMLLTPLIILGIFLQDPMHPYGSKQYSKMSPSISFFVDHVDESKAIKVLSSLDITGHIFYRATQLGKKNIYPYMFGKDVEILYSHDPEMVTDLFQAKSYDFLLLSREFERRVVFADGWYWAPIATEATSLITTNSGFDRTYDDGQAVIFAYNK